jgi:hypothetical protein
VVKKKPVKTGPATAAAEQDAVIKQRPIEVPVQPAAPLAVQTAMVTDEPDLTLPWVLLALFLLLLLVVRRNRKERIAGADRASSS